MSVMKISHRVCLVGVPRAPSAPTYAFDSNFSPSAEAEISLWTMGRHGRQVCETSVGTGLHAEPIVPQIGPCGCVITVFEPNFSISFEIFLWVQYTVCRTLRLVPSLLPGIRVLIECRHGAYDQGNRRKGTMSDSEGGIAGVVEDASAICLLSISSREVNLSQLHSTRTNNGDRHAGQPRSRHSRVTRYSCIQYLQRTQVTRPQRHSRLRSWLSGVMLIPRQICA